MTSANESYDCIIVGAGSAGCVLANRLPENAASRVLLLEAGGGDEYHGIAGPLTLAASQVTIFTKSDPSVERPDIQFHMQPLSADKPGEGAHKFSAFTSSVYQLRPHSRCHIEMKSSGSLEYPAIHPNYLSDERDHHVAVGGVKVARRIAKAPSLVPHIIDEYVPEGEPGISN